MIASRSAVGLSVAALLLSIFVSRPLASAAEERVFTGEAAIDGGEVEAARQAALAAALAAARAQLDPQLVEDLASNPDGVGGWQLRIVDEAKTKTQYRVRLGARFVPRGASTTATAAHGGAAAPSLAPPPESPGEPAAPPGSDPMAGGCPVMVVVQQVFKQGRKKSTYVDGQVAARLEHLLQENGFTIVGQEGAKGICSDAPPVYDRWRNDSSRVLATARANGADLLIAGRVVIHDKGVIENAAFAAINGQRRIEVEGVFRGYHVATGQLFATQPDMMASMGVSLERAMARLLSGKGRNFVDRSFLPLMADMKQGCGVVGRPGYGLQIVLEGVRSYRRQGKPFEALVAGLPGVTAVEGELNGDRLKIGVTCECSGSDLLPALLDALEAAPPGAELGTADVVSVTGPLIVLTL